MNNIDILEQFISTRGWSMIRSVLLERIGITSCWIAAPNGQLIFNEEQDHLYCRAIKATPKGGIECGQVFKDCLNQAIEQKTPTVFSCPAGFLGFYCPILVDNTVVGILGGCEMIDPRVEPAHYVSLIERFSVQDKNTFLASLERGHRMSVAMLEQDIELISLICQLAMETKTKHHELTEKSEEIHTLAEFYKLFEESRMLILTLEPEKLYSLIVNLTARAMKAELVSLMLIDPLTQEMNIKAAIGMDDTIIKKTKLPVGRGVVGYVAKTGEPLLVKDVTNDSRFTIQQNSPKYYTKSLISAPIKIGDEILGVINVNNKATRQPFNESDIKLLSIICGHAAIAVKNSKVMFSEEKEKVSAEINQYVVQLEETEDEKKELLEEREKAETKLRETEEMIRIKEELIQSKEALLREKEAAATSMAEKEKLQRELDELEKEKEELEKEKEELLEEVKGKEVLIHEKEVLEKKTEELIKEKEELEAQTEELGILYSISREIPLMSLPQEILFWVLERIQQFFNYHAGSYLYFDNDRLVSQIKQACFVNDNCLNHIKRQLESAWTETNPDKIKKVAYSTEDGEAGNLYWIGVEKFQSFLIAPLNYRGEIIGFLNINSFNENAFTPLQRRLLTIVANQVSVTLEKVRLFAKVKEMAERDELTKMYNYRYLEDLMVREFSFADQYQSPLTFLMLDFDRLKFVNDTFGHAEGNRLIVTISDIIKETVGNKGTVARFGGDEFAVVLPETDQNTGFNLADKIRGNIYDAPYQISGKPHQLSASLGTATYPNQGISTEKELLAKADKALYDAKQQGRNKVVSYMPGNNF
ncbi:diguanylate cyclase [bacterium]|nr:diguanylate cyclase [bacterium]MBU1753484.1 diguanylate cyclase [bacterium]